MSSATIPLYSESVSVPSEVCRWSTDRLSDEAVRAIQTCRKHGQAAAQSAWREGAYLSLLHARLIKGRKWATWLRQQKEIVTEHTARRYILLYERTRGQVTELDGMTLTEAYAAFGITRFTDVASSNQSEPDHRLSGNGVHKLASILPGTQDQDEEEILKAATQIRQQRIADRGRLEAEKQEAARVKLNGKRTWALTDESKVVRCDLLIADPPFGITDEPWEPKDVEGFTRDWCKSWSTCGADFIAIFWCQERLWEGRTWFDHSIKGYEFQQLLTWQANNHCGPKSRLSMKQSWYPIFLYRRRRSARRIIKNDKEWDTERHNLDCFVAPVPQTVYKGEDLKQHPCQKPVSVMRWLINALSEPGELVCSLFAGVCPCGVASVQLGRRYRGIEQSAEYRRIGEGRIAAYKDKPQEDDQEDEEEILRAAAEIRQRRVAERLKEIQEKRQQSRPVRLKKRDGPVLHGDCLDLIPTLEDASVSLVVTSPPYAEQRKGHYGGIPEEDYPDFTVQWMTALAPKMSKDGSVFLVIRPHLQDGVLSDYVLRTRLALREAAWNECEELIWVKPNAPPLGSKLRPRRAWESILWFSRSPKPYCNLKACGKESHDLGFTGDIRFAEKGFSERTAWHPCVESFGNGNGVARITDVIVAPVGTSESGLDHPAVFPMGLAEQLIKTFSQEGDLVLDNFCGSGQTLLAAKGCGRRFLGIEREEKYVKIALGRLR